MPKSPLSSSETKRLSILAAIVIIVLGFAGFVSLSTFWNTTRNQEVEVSGEITNYSGLSAQVASAQEITATPTPAKSLLVQDAFTPTPFTLPEPTFTPEPTSTPTRVNNTPTSTLTPSPTATSFLTATDTPASTPTPLSTATNPPTATLTPTLVTESGIKHVVIISIDGLRPDALDLANTPILDNLRAKGAYSPKAQTIPNSVTLPSHASMLTGMVEDKHGIHWGLPYIGWPGMNGPTVFSVAHDAGLSTAMAFGKEKLNYTILPNSVDKCFGKDAHDSEVKDQAIEFIEEGLPNLFFIHFPDNDRVGHAYGWVSENQLYAINYVDGLIGELLTALDSGGYLNNTLLIVTADHGGHGQGHGDDAPLDRTIPWLAVGPGVPQGVTLGSAINTYDTAATAAYALELPIPEKWDGKPILEIFE